MNIHLVHGAEDTEYYVYESFVSMTQVTISVSENIIDQWAETNNIEPLLPEDRYKSGDGSGKTTQYLLTEKQSALFLLRFK